MSYLGTNQDSYYKLDMFGGIVDIMMMIRGYLVLSMSVVVEKATMTSTRTVLSRIMIQFLKQVSVEVRGTYHCGRSIAKNGKEHIPNNI